MVFFFQAKKAKAVAYQEQEEHKKFSQESSRKLLEKCSFNRVLQDIKRGET